MNQSTCATIYPSGSGSPMTSGFPDTAKMNPQTAILDLFLPGFGLFSSTVSEYLHIDLTLYIPALIVLGLIVFASQHINTYIWEIADQYLMSTADVRIDDEIYNMLMAWISNQKFAKRSRRFVANTNLNSRMWFLWREFNEDGDNDETGVEFDENGNAIASSSKKKNKTVRFTPSFGTHYFFYKGKLLIFRRTEDTRQQTWGPVSEREQISVQCFGRDPTILKDLLDECRVAFQKSDENRTIIYRGGLKSGTAEPAWTRCVSRVSRPFSTVVLDETVKQNLLDDMRDYLHPMTRRWYSNRGIPYRRGYLLYGPPGTGKSSLSFAIAGYFKLKIYIVSLNSPAMNEENLGTLFSELPKQCVVLLEDIDTAGLTHTRDNNNNAEPEEAKPLITTLPGTTVINPAAPPTNNSGRISLSALLNILDGVASQEGRVLIMTTNHIEKLDEALIRPGRVDMTVKFDLANTAMITTIFRSIFATLEGDIPPSKNGVVIRPPIKYRNSTEEAHAAKLAEEAKKLEEEAALKLKVAEEERVRKLGEEFATIVPTMTFSPAEVQGYLLKHKRAPENAVKEGAAWVEKMKLEKRKKAKEEEEEKAKKDKEGEEDEETKRVVEEAIGVSL
ncbi:related to BCS1 protein precursor [Phialocephala subalpina]|uniref:Related to BCS1 protein n=1 Tax=Phialocephala subalpina TaxID=576137 RepID=A0A1L7X8T9_9HELO|nr:related to BCS1 protein precursor [Phialocephala subalpina]